MSNKDDEITPLPPKYQEKSTEVIQQTLELEESDTDSIDEPVQGREPTDEELATLRRVAERIPLRAWYLSPFSVERR